MSDWKPCTKETPDASGHFWATCEYTKSDDRFVSVACFVKDFLLGDDYWDEDCRTYRVIAWMQMEKPEAFGGGK
jgi:hypothetical protein